jgi:hypothetical protein
MELFILGQPDIDHAHSSSFQSCMCFNIQVERIYIDCKYEYYLFVTRRLACRVSKEFYVLSLVSYWL